MAKKVAVGAKAKEVDILPVKAKVVNAPGMSGTLPFGMGVIGDAKDMPDFVQAELRAMEDKASKVPEKELRKAVAPPTPVDIDSLPPEKIAELKDAIKSANKSAAAIPMVNQSIPGLAKAMKVAQKAASYTPTEAKEDKPVEIPKPSLCSHCGWDTNNPDNIEITALDKQLFVASILGQKRFTKEFKLFGGKLKVVFRSITTKEMDLVIQQLTKDWNDGKIGGQAQSLAEAIKYRMYISLDTIDGENGIIHQLPEVADYEYDKNDVKDGGTVLPLIVDHLTDTVLTMETLRSAVTKVYGTFVATESKLEAMAAAPSFWETIAN